MVKAYCSVATLAVTAATILGCTRDLTTPGPTPENDAASILPPEGLEVPGGELFALDTEQPDVSVTLPSGGRIVGRLAGNDGQRELLWQASADKPLVQVAGPDWHLPPAAATAQDGTTLLCWNRLTGPIAPGASMPHPSKGLAIACRAGNDEFDAEFAAGDDGPNWLKRVLVDAQGRFVIQYYHDTAGWLVADPLPGDGLFEQTFDGDRLSAPARVSSR